MVYVQTKYGEPTIVFENYNSASTKDMTHKSRTKGMKGISISFTKSSYLNVSQDDFLRNYTNKQNFITLLSFELINGAKFFHSDNDADYLIVTRAIESANKWSTVLIGVTQLC